MIGALALALHAYAALAIFRALGERPEPRRVLARIGKLLWISAGLSFAFSILIPPLASKIADAPGIVDRVGWIAAAVQCLRAVLLVTALASWIGLVRPDLRSPRKFIVFLLAILALEGPAPLALFGVVALIFFMRGFHWHEALRGARRSRILLGALIGLIPLFPMSWDSTFPGPPGGDGLKIRSSSPQIRVLPAPPELPGVRFDTGVVEGDEDDEDLPVPEPFASVARRLAPWNRAARASSLVLGMQGAFLLLSFFPPLLRLHGVGLKRRFAVMMALVRSVPAVLALLLLSIVVYFAVGIHRVSRATDALEGTLDQASLLAGRLAGAVADSTRVGDAGAPLADLLGGPAWLESAASGPHVVLRQGVPVGEPEDGRAAREGARGPALVAATPDTPAPLVGSAPFGAREPGTRRGLAVIDGRLYLVASSARATTGGSLAVADVFVPVDSAYAGTLARTLRSDVRFETVPGQIISRSVRGLTMTDSTWAEHAIVLEAAGSSAPLRPAVASAGGLSVRIEDEEEPVDAATTARPGFLSRPVYLGRRTLPVGEWSASHESGGACRLTLRATPVSFLRSIPSLALMIGEFNLGLPVIVIVLVAIGVLQPISIGVGRGILKGILEDVGNLTTAARKLGEGDLDHVVPVRGNDELGGLAVSFNTMAANLKRQREELKEKERMAADLAVARDIQRRLLPQGPPSVAGLDVAGTSIPTHEVGGDLFHFITLPGGRLALALGDVAGKGVSAALLMSNALAGLRAHVQDEAGVGDCMTNMNRHVNDQVEPGRFVTFFYGVIDPAAGEVRYGSAGHNPSLVVESGGATRWLSEGGPPFGLGIDLPYAETIAPLRAGDVLVLYSDGVTEAISLRGDGPGGKEEPPLTETVEESFYGEDRLEATVVALRKRSAREILDGIVESVRVFAAGEPQADDMTLVVVKVV